MNMINTMAKSRIVSILMLMCCWQLPCTAQNEKASINSSIADDGTGRIVVEARGQLPKVKPIYTVKAEANVTVGTEAIDQEIRLVVKVVQGKPKTVSLGLNGSAAVVAVEGDQVQSWSVRQAGQRRFLDLKLKPEVVNANPLIAPL